jgi:phenylpropionate dioxygenase-like ring-hydroxylating dioxygenase large terminal subunit
MKAIAVLLLAYCSVALAFHAPVLHGVHWPHQRVSSPVRGLKAAGAVAYSHEPSLQQVNGVTTSKTEHKSVFQWSKHWYPVGVADSLDSGRPHAIQLLGRHLVLWFDAAEQQWRVFDDACPHRFAPLSEGRIEKDSSLQCAYHGWRFNGSGACTLIPQSPAAAAEQHAASPRACAVSYPTCVKYGIIFAWGERGLQAAVDASQHDPLSVPQLDDAELMASGRVTLQPLYARQLPFGWEAAMENFMVNGTYYTQVSYMLLYHSTTIAATLQLST